MNEKGNWKPRRTPSVEHAGNWAAHKIVVFWPSSLLMKTCPSWLLVRAMIYANDARFYVSPLGEESAS